MSAKWEDVVAHLGRECARLGLTLRLQNCPGWSMSGGPWIDDKHAMRKIVIDGTGRDYRRIGSVAFPSYTGEEDGVQMPTSVETNGDVRVFTFGKDVTLRSLVVLQPCIQLRARIASEVGCLAKWRLGARFRPGISSFQLFRQADDGDVFFQADNRAEMAA